MRIGIFGGTFNPIHIAHLYIAEEVRETMGLDLVVFVPAAMPPHKEVEYGVPAERRLEMAKLAVAGNPAFKVSDLELTLPRPSYSIKTVEILQGEYGGEARLFFVTGMDSFLDVGAWHEAERLLGMCDFVTTFRPGARHFDLGKHPFVREIDMAMLDMLDVKERSLGKVELTTGRDLWLVSSVGMDISSTDIRRRIRAGRSVKYLLPEAVESYIIQNKLYRQR